MLRNLMIGGMGLFLCSCAFFQHPSSYEDVVKLSVESGQVVTQLAHDSSVQHKDYVGCVASSVLLGVFHVPLDLYKSKKEDLSIPTVEVDISSCESFGSPENMTTKEVFRKIDGIVGPILSAMDLYSVEISCREMESTRQFIEWLFAAEKEISKEIQEPNGKILLEGRKIDLSVCE